MLHCPKAPITACLLSLAVAACGSGGDRICSPPLPLSAAHDKLIASQGVAEVIAAREAAEACVHRWAYRLASAADPAEVVARAVVAACDDAPAYNLRARAGLLQKNNMPFDGGAMVAEGERLKGLALFRVVQARAGRCPVPE